MRELERKPGGGSSSAKGIEEIYPSEFVGDRAYPGESQSVPRAVAEPRAIRCRQCNYPIRDTSTVSTCPNCGSDNFEGRVIST